VDKYHTIKGQRMDIRRSAYLINQKVEVNTAQLIAQRLRWLPC